MGKGANVHRPDVCVDGAIRSMLSKNVWQVFIMNYAKAAIAAVAFVCAMPSAYADTWRGTAPFCDGQCRAGETEVRRSKTGNGARCWTGTKVLCRNIDPLCVPLQTRTKCYAVVMVCDDGYYEFPTNQWKSCSKYACGACFGFDF